MFRYNNQRVARSRSQFATLKKGKIMVESLIPTEKIEKTILLIRGQKVILDTDLAKLYGVTTKRLNEQVKRNKDRFPDDFMFQLTNQEVVRLRSQFATLKKGRGQHRKYQTYAFTEHGSIMAANVLNSKQAIMMSVHVVRAFVKLRELISTHTQLAKKIADLEKRYDHQFKIVFDAIRALMMPPNKPQKKIGFGVQ
jgi:phage regulator Rha-like protein